VHQNAVPCCQARMLPSANNNRRTCTWQRASGQQRPQRRQRRVSHIAIPAMGIPCEGAIVRRGFTDGARRAGADGGGQLARQQPVEAAQLSVHVPPCNAQVAALLR